jgi:hypothetical protein
LFTVLHLETRLDSLGESHGIARSTSLLVSDRPRKVKSINRSQIKLLWNLVIWDSLGVFPVLFNPRLSLTQCLHETFVLGVAERAGGLVKLEKVVILERGASVHAWVLRVVRLEKTAVSLPSEVRTVDGADQDVHGI